MSGAMSRRKGSTAERAVVNYLRDNGWPHAERKGTGFPGADVAELGPGLELEIKNHARLDLAGWVDQLTAAMYDTDADMGAVIVKRRGTTDVGQWYFVQPTHLADQLIRSARVTASAVYPGPFRASQLNGSLDPLVRHCEDNEHTPIVVMERVGRARLEDYSITTVAHGARLLRQAGWGDPIEPKETTRP